MHQFKPLTRPCFLANQVQVPSIFQVAFRASIPASKFMQESYQFCGDFVVAFSGSKQQSNQIDIDRGPVDPLLQLLDCFLWEPAC